MEDGGERARRYPKEEDQLEWDQQYSNQKESQLPRACNWRHGLSERVNVDSTRGTSLHSQAVLVLGGAPKFVSHCRRVLVARRGPHFHLVNRHR